jgi:hypothetical protein
MNYSLVVCEAPIMKEAASFYGQLVSIYETIGHLTLDSTARTSDLTHKFCLIMIYPVAPQVKYYLHMDNYKHGEGARLSGF